MTTGPPIVIPNMNTAQVFLDFIAAAKDLENGNESDRSSTPGDTPSDSPTLKQVADVQTMTVADMIHMAANSTSSSDASKSMANGKPTREIRIKRPMNAFMVWSQQRRQQIAATGQKFHNSDISKMLGAEWRTMQEHEKIPFVERAKQLRDEHFTTYPDYVYRPRRRKRLGKSTGSVDSVSTDESSGSPTIPFANPFATFMTALALVVSKAQQATSSAST